MQPEVIEKLVGLRQGIPQKDAREVWAVFNLVVQNGEIQLGGSSGGSTYMMTFRAQWLVLSNVSLYIFLFWYHILFVIRQMLPFLLCNWRDSIPMFLTVFLINHLDERNVKSFVVYMTTNESNSAGNISYWKMVIHHSP